LRGYWGDYDSMHTRGNGLDRWASLIRPAADSTAATCVPTSWLTRTHSSNISSAPARRGSP